MSNTYSIVCDDCRVRSWVGQKDYLYTKPNNIAKFLHDHITHKLSFICDLVEDDAREQYAEVEYE